MNAPRTDALCVPPMPCEREWYDHARKIEDELEWLWANCRIVYYPPGGEYPIEHTMAARKDSREMIEAARAKWSNKQVDRLFDELRHLADPYDLEKALPAANAEISGASGEARRIIARILQAAERGGLNEAYLAKAAEAKCKRHRVSEWRLLPTPELLNFSRTIHARASAKAKAAPSPAADTSAIDMPF